MEHGIAKRMEHGKLQLISRQKMEESKKIFSREASPELSLEEIESVYNLCMVGSAVPEIVILEGVFITRETLKIPEVAEWFEKKLFAMRKSQEEKAANRKNFLDGLKDPFGNWRKNNET